MISKTKSIPVNQNAMYHSQGGSGQRRKSARSEYAGSHRSGNSGRSTRSKRKGASLKAKVLPPDFAERVLNLELSIDQGNFNMDTINDLLLLYS